MSTQDVSLSVRLRRRLGAPGSHREDLVTGPSYAPAAVPASCERLPALPEDVGGPPGYVDFIEAIPDPRHDEHHAMLEWCGGAFDPYAFDLQAVNADLKQLNL